MHYRPIHALLISGFLIIGMLSVFFRKVPENYWDERETPYNEYELQFLQSQGVTFDSVGEPLQLYVERKRESK